MAKFHQCYYCKQSYRSDDERKDHERICVKNGKTKSKQFEARKHLSEQRNKEQILKETGLGAI